MKENKTVVIYPGRFQPFSKHHAAAFLWVQKEFPDADAYIATSNVTDSDKSPFNFDEKKSIIDVYGLGKYVKKVVSPYKSEEILKKYDPKSTVLIFVVGEKDRDRLAGSYYKPYPKNPKKLNSYEKNAYVVIAPHIHMTVKGKELSGSEARKILGNPKISDEKKKEVFKNIFGWYSYKMYKFITNKLKKNALKELKLFSKEWWNIGLNESIPGGLSQGKTIEDIAYHHLPNLRMGIRPLIVGLKKQLEQGIKVEMEHTTDKNIAKEIAMDHLWENPMYYSKLVKANLQEGGVAGHMNHPFNLPTVNTGADLIKVFKDAVNYVSKKPAAVKIDGLNNSIKLVNEKGKEQFGLDFGTMRDVDIKGITLNDIGSRFDTGHGMIQAGTETLTAFNKCLPYIQKELAALGLSSKPKINNGIKVDTLLNIEIVLVGDDKRANVIEYDKNFFVIHGTVEATADLKTKKRTKKIKSGPSARIEALVKKAKPIMEKLGFGIYGMIGTKVKEKINLAEPLNSTLTVKYGPNKKVTKSLKDWLKTAENPRDAKIKYLDGTTGYAMNKKNYLNILNQALPLVKLTTNPDDHKKLIDGAVMYHATRILGNAILKALGSEVGDVLNHEGIVIRTDDGQTFKITGEFIVDSLSSKFGKK
jgi:hypothetical protein